MKFWENLTLKSYRLSTSPVRCSHCIFGNRKKVIFNCIILTYFWLFTLSHKKQSVIHLPTPPEITTTLTCELQNFFIRLEVCCVLSDVESCEKSQLWVVVGGSEKKPVVMSGNWNIKQAMSQQVFRVTTFCINTCFQSFSTLVSHVVHHAVLKFSPCCNKPLPQASTRPYQHTRSSCSVPQTQY